MAPDIPLALQTVYAELVDRCADDAFLEAFPEPGEFTSKQVKGRTYWYFQSTRDGRRTQKYVGPETPELLQRIANHRDLRSAWKQRREMVQTLKKARMPAPDHQTGAVIAALANAGVFRLRAILVGTLAYQTYAPLLGVRLTSQSLRTDDVDIAQFQEISVAIQDQTPPLLDVLKEVDPTFMPVAKNIGSNAVTAYATTKHLRVEFLTPNEGPDDEDPRRLPALQTSAVPLRFLDYLIHEPAHAVILHEAGILVNVPAPHRYALHKLIVARRREKGSPKIDKDISQANALLPVLLQKRKPDLRDALAEALARGPRWRRYIAEGLEMINPKTADGIRLLASDSAKTTKGNDLHRAGTDVADDDDDDHDHGDDDRQKHDHERRR